MNKRALMILLAILLIVASLVAFTSIGSLAQPTTGSVWTAQLSGFQEVSPKFTTATGTFMATASTGELTYQLTYSGTEGTVRGAQISFGQPGVNGDLLVFLCGNNPPAKQVCPANAGTISGTITAADVLNSEDQNVSSGDFNALLSIIQHGAAYINVTSSKFTEGELRGTIVMGTATPAP